MTRFAAIGLVWGLTALALPAKPQAASQPAKKDATPPAKAALKTDPAEAEALAKVLRDLLRQNLPDPLTQTSQNWGHQTAVTVVRRQREGWRIWTEPVQELRNDGLWRRITVRLPDPDKVFLAVTELTHPKDGQLVATIGVVAERVDVRFEQQLWRNGVRLYGGETRAHCKGGVLIKAEVTTKAEFKKGSLLPDVTLQVKATEARIVHEDIVVDHTAGLDGEAAKVLGDVMLRTVKAFKPDLERDLLAKGNAAIVKAAGSRELKTSLDRLLKK